MTAVTDKSGRDNPWNRYASAALDLFERTLGLESKARFEAVLAAHLASGYSQAAAYRESLVLTRSWEGRRRLAEAPAWDGEAWRSPESLILNIRKSTARCEKDSVLVKCGCGATIHDKGCERSSCLRCAPRVGQKRARRVFDKLTATVDAQRARAKGARDPRTYAVRVTVLTIPLELRDRYVRPKAIATLRKQVWELLRDEFGAAWACVMLHPVGDEDPTQFHPHVNVLWGKRGIAPGKMPEHELELLKERWAELLCYSNPVVVWAGFVRRDEEGKLRHRARYYSRVFAGWAPWMPKAVQWYGDYVRGLAPPAVVCPCCKEGFGILAAGLDAIELYQRLAAAQQSAAGPPEEMPQ